MSDANDEQTCDKKVLIVEDEKPMARALQLKLENVGCSVTTADNGNVALEQLEEGSFDIILLDLIMPEMDGFAFLEKMQEKEIDTPVVVLSNLSQEEDEQKVRELGAVDYLVKSNTSVAEIVSYVTEFDRSAS